MNFIKNTWKSLFKNQQQPNKEKEVEGQAPKAQQQQQQQIPQQIVQQLFTLASELIKKSKAITEDATKLKIYGLYKQATQGDCTAEKPQMFDFVGKSKWNAWDQLKGMSKKQAMMDYVRVVSQTDDQVRRQISEKLGVQDGEKGGEEGKAAGTKTKQRAGHMKVQKVDYSDEYSHPYFKPIQKGQPIPTVTHQLLLTKNNAPEVYPLHFAIQKQRLDLVQQFLPLLTIAQIQKMTDTEGTGILEYAQLMENDQILQLVREKLKNKDK